MAATGEDIPKKPEFQHDWGVLLVTSADYARGLRSRRILIAACALALAVPSAAEAQVTIGANLARAPNATYDCSALPTIDAFGGRTFLPSTYVHGIFGGAPITTCTYLAVQGLGGTGEIAQAPGAGTITQVAVRVGPTTGPMQAVVLRAIRSRVTQSGGCCTVVAGSQTFTPAPNTVTVVPVNLPVGRAFSADENVGEAVDYLGLSVLAPGVPIPVQDLGTPGNVTLPGALAFFPAFDAQQPTRADGAGVGAVVPLLSATFVGCPGAAARAAQVAACPDRTAPALAALRLARRTLSLQVSEPSRLIVTLRRGGRTRTLRATVNQAGTVKLKVPRSVKKGSYRAVAQATDAAGNSSKTLTRTVRLK